MFKCLIVRCLKAIICLIALTAWWAWLAPHNVSSLHYSILASDAPGNMFPTGVLFTRTMLRNQAPFIVILLAHH